MDDEKIKLMPEIEQLTEKLLADPKSRVFAQLADAYRKCGMFDEAIDTVKRGLEIHPQYAVAHLILGRCYMAKKMYALAREEFELTVKNDPQNLVGLRLLAETYERQNMYPEAVKYYQMVLDLDPTNMDIAEKVENLKGAIRPAPSFQPPEPEPAAVIAPKTQAEPAPSAPFFEPETAAEPKIETFEGKLPERAPAEPAPDAIQDLKQALELEAAAPAEAPQPSGEAVLELPSIPIQAAAAADADEESAGATTVTLAELYASQGHYEKAVEAYRELVAKEPDNQAYKIRMDELLSKLYPELDQVPDLRSTDTSDDAVAASPLPAEPAAVQEGKPAEERSVELAGMFAEMEKLAVVAEPDLPAPASQEPPRLESVFSLGGEGEATGAEPAPAEAALSALFAEETPAPQSLPPQPSEPVVKDEAPPPQEKEEPKENAVSSFQAWLNSIQK